MTLRTETLPAAPPSYTLWQLVVYMLRLGTFGGPVALVGYMHRDLVERQWWITESDYREGLALAQLAPGPMAAQTAIYLGYVHYRILGATLAGLTFVLPSFLMVVALGWAYSRFGGLTWMQAVFYGVGAAVIGIIAISAHKLTLKSVDQDKLLWAIYLIVAAVTVITESEIAWLFLAAGVAVWLWRVPPKRWFGSGLAAALPMDLPQAGGLLAGLDWSLLTQIGLFFAKAGAFVFGSGLAIVPFLYSGVVTGAVIVIAKRSIVDLPTAALAIATVALLWKFKKLQEPVIVLGAAAIGMLIYPLLHS